MRSIAFFLFCSIGCSASAATVNVTGSVGAAFSSDSVNINSNTSETGKLAAGAVVTGLGSQSANIQYSVSIEKGTVGIKADARASGLSAVGTANILAGFTEIVNATGNGFVDLSARVTGSYSVIDTDEDLGSLIFNVGFGGPVGLTGIIVSTTDSGVFDETITQRIKVQENTTFNAGLLTQLQIRSFATNTDFADFSFDSFGTSTLSITPSLGVTISYSDPNFLSAQQAIIPLPQTSLLLMSGILAFLVVPGSRSEFFEKITQRFKKTHKDKILSPPCSNLRYESHNGRSALA